MPSLSRASGNKQTRIRCKHKTLSWPHELQFSEVDQHLKVSVKSCYFKKSSYSFTFISPMLKLPMRFPFEKHLYLWKEARVGIKREREKVKLFAIKEWLYAGVPGWLSWLSICLLILAQVLISQSWSQWLWAGTLHWARHGACLGFSLGPSLLTCALFLSLKINKY